MTDTLFSIDQLSPEELMAVLEQLEQAGAAPTQAPAQEAIIAADDSQRVFPLSLAQQRLWVLSQIDAATTAAYVIAGGLRVQGKLNIKALNQALDRIVSRHAALRTHIEIHAGEPMQILGEPDCGFMLTQGEAETEAQVQLSSVPEFDLMTGPLVQGQLTRLNEHDHILQFWLHHMIADGWSLGVLIEELSVLYTAFAQGEADPLPPLAIQFGDYARWQRTHVQGSVLEQQLQYWVSHLQGAPEYLTLPTDRSRPEQQDYIGHNVAVTLDTELTAALKALSQRHGCTLHMTLLASWAALMSRLSGQEDVVIGSPVAGRTRKEVEGLIGMFVNTQALRIDLSEPLNTEALLAQVKATSLGAQSHQDIPFEQVVEAIAPTRSFAYSPIFQVAFALQNLPDADVKLPEMTLSLVEMPDPAAKVDLSLMMYEHDGELSGYLNYAIALFDEETIGRYVGYWQKLLKGMVADSQQCVQSMAILSDSERSQVLYGVNQTEMPFEDEACIHQLFERFAAETPENTALVTECESLTYHELNYRANRLAHWLIAQGVTPDCRIAVALPRSADLLITMLATLKAGGVYVPMDPNYPDARLAHMLADSAPVVLITTAEIRLRLGEDADGRIEVDLHQSRSAWETCATTNPIVSSLTAQHLAYIIYTSGSTGKPKGVMVPHQGLCNVSMAQRHMFSVGIGSRVLQFGSISFDASMFEIVMGICSGAELHFAGAGQPIGEALFEIMQSRRITHAPLPPAALSSLRTDIELPDLRFLLTAGEAITRSAILLWLREGRDVYNGYGPTETTIWGTTCALHHAFAGQPPIGLPRPNGKIYILDTAGEPVPIGVTGEIYIGGVGIARGYLNRPDLTEASFLVDPFSDQPFSVQTNARMYRTGDLGCWQPDGLIHYRGRCDNQVKIRGFRIELGEIETVLQSCAGIQDAVVVAQANSKGNQRLVGYYTSQPEADVSLATLKSQLSETLPDYMVPAAYVALDVLPLTPNGKVDRNALPMADETAFARQAYEAPEGEIETLLATLWEDLLGVQHVGRQDHFFELGGHSLLSVQLIEQLRQRGYHLGVKSLFNHPTLAALAAILSADDVTTVAIPPNLIPDACAEITPEMLPLTDLTPQEIDTITATVDGGVANVQDIYPLAPLQEGILFHHLLNPESDPYITPVILAFDEKARLDDFLAALQAVIQRHDILRTAVVWNGLHEAQQVVWRHAGLSVTELTVTELTVADLVSDEAVQSIDVVQALQNRFAPAQMQMDIAQAPLLAGYQVEDPSQDRWLFCLLQHHLCMDHTTLELVIEEVQAHLLGQQAHLTAPVPFRNFVAQARIATDRDAYMAYFRAQLADIDTTSAPFDLWDTQGTGHQIESQRYPVDDALAQQLREQARVWGVSAASLFHLVWGLVVRSTTGRDDVVFGTVLFGRMAGGEGADRALGMFLNTLPLRLSLGNIEVGSAVQQTHALLAELLNYEHAPLSLVQQCSGVGTQTPLFTSLLNYRYQGGSAQTESSAVQSGAAWQGIEMLANEERTNYPIGLSVDDFVGQGFWLDLKVDERIGCDRIAAMVQKALVALVDALVHEPARTVNQLRVLSETERTQVVKDFNQTETPFPDGSCIHQHFEQQVLSQPDATAVCCEDASLTYAQLNQQANQLAHWLVEQGVRPDSRVAVSLERSCDLVVALVAILKSGGAYVPLDPGYPQERLEYMLADSQPVVLLTTQTLAMRLGPLPEATTLVDMAVPERPWAGYSADNLAPERLGLTCRHLAYIIYTSGSTGNPKGVMNEHRGVVNRLRWMKDDYGFGPDDVVLQKTPFSFDVSVWEFFCPLWAGATLVMAKPEGHKDPVYLRELIEQREVSILHFVPPMLQMFLEVVSPQNCPSLRLMFCSGEALLAETVRKTGARLPHVALHNLYGPTEAAVDVTAWACPGDLEGDRVSIGAPVANTQMYVLDSQGEPIPVGVSGELYIGGVQVARGYLNRPELTAERFVLDPFSVDADARLYRTGDLGCWLADGTIEYQGRNDDQVKIRGFRIELGEISSALQECAGVQEAVVVALPVSQRNSDKRLVAYYTETYTETGTEGYTEEESLQDEHPRVTIEALKGELSGQLPEHMVPAAYVVLEEMPLTPNGKVNRKVLPAPDEDALVRHGYEAPEGEVETCLAEIWQALLGIEQVGRHDNFFELGGHSLMAIRLISEVQKHGFKLDLVTLFAAPVLDTLAMAVTQPQRQAEQVIPFRATGSQSPLFIVPEFSGELLYGPGLTAAIDADIPVYGLTAPDRMQPSLKTFQQMATRYVQMIRQTQPQGPYRLFGWSSGGVLAYEIAAQLLGQDQSIEFLGLLDSWRPGVIEQPEQSDDALMCQLSRGMVTYLAEQQSGHAVDLPESEAWCDYYRIAQSLGCLPDGWSEDYFQHMLIHQRDFLKAEYQVESLPIHLDLIAAQGSPAIEPYLGWEQVLPAEQIRLVTVPGGHYELVSAPYVAGVGQAISHAVAQRVELANKKRYSPHADPVRFDRSYEPLLKLQAGGWDQPVVICIPGAGDNVFSFVELVQSIAPNWTVLALQPRGLWGSGVPHSSVEAAADFYLQVLQTALNYREIHVLGHSFGGWVATELVAKMEAQGIEVASLTIADSRVPTQQPLREYTDVQALGRLIELFEMKGQSIELTQAQLAGWSPSERLKVVHQRLIEKGLMPKNTQPNDLAGIYRVFATNIRTRYAPSVLPQAPARLVLASDSSSDLISGWQSLLSDLKVTRSDGNHIMLLKSPYVRVLADMVQGKETV